MSDDRLLTAAEALASRLRAKQQRLVFAESCTAGLAAATLGRIPGISEFLCGSAVVYRNATKTAWLGVPAEQLNDPSIGPVSPQTADDMARGVLMRTPEADLAASITGHLGPDAPRGLDGVTYIAIACRGDSGAIDVRARRHVLDDAGGEPLAVRRHRQVAAACGLLECVIEHLDRSN